MHDRLFKLGTTSFIVPDHIIPNVKKLGPFFDEIELLIFESQPKEVLPSLAQVNELLDLSEQFNLTYNVHLPVDVSLSSFDLDEQLKAKQTLLETIALFERLPVTTHTLHLEMPKKLKAGMNEPDQIKSWKDGFRNNFIDFLSEVDNQTLSIETLDYPFNLINDLVKDHALPVCLDMGHTIKYGYGKYGYGKYGYGWQPIVQQHHSTIPLIHLHGVDFSTPRLKDHQRLDCLPKDQLDPIMSFLKSYTGTVSLEVFNLKNLTGSLKCLSKHFNKIPKIISL